MRIITNWKTIGYSDHVRRYAAVTGIRDTAVLNTAEQLYQDLISSNNWGKTQALFPFWGTNAFQNQINFKDNLVGIAGFTSGITHEISGLSGNVNLLTTINYLNNQTDRSLCS